MFSNLVVFNKRLVFILLTLATIFGSKVCYAMDGGSRDGGGGDSLVSDFVAYANVLFAQYPGDAVEKALLKETLKKSKIISVQSLKNPVSGNEIPDQAKLIAWGSPGLIQLKLDSGKPGEESWDSKVSKGEAVAHYIVHELYRATGIVDENGRSPDDIFQISVGKLHLNQMLISAGSVYGVSPASQPNGCGFFAGLFGQCSIEKLGFATSEYKSLTPECRSLDIKINNDYSKMYIVLFYEHGNDIWDLTQDHINSGKKTGVGGDVVGYDKSEFDVSKGNFKVFKLQHRSRDQGFNYYDSGWYQELAISKIDNLLKVQYQHRSLKESGQYSVWKVSCLFEQVR